MQNKKYGEFGGQYVSESLMTTLKELEDAYNEAINDPKFWEEYDYYMKDYVGRENPLM
jgi:tryptophan synthase beta chain